MGKEISTGLRYILLVHFILGIIIGIVFLLFPEQYCLLFGIVINDHGMYRLIGAASLALGFSSCLAYQNKDWDVVKLFVQMELVWLVGANIGMIWWLATTGPIMAWVIEIMFILFLVAFLLYYFLEKK